jgi:hypothetical protein
MAQGAADALRRCSSQVAEGVEHVRDVELRMLRDDAMRPPPQRLHFGDQRPLLRAQLSEIHSMFLPYRRRASNAVPARRAAPTECGWTPALGTR